MNTPSGRIIGTIYCLNLTIFIALVCFSLWNYYFGAFGVRKLSWLSFEDVFKTAVNLSILALLGSRFIKVILKPTTLDVFVTNGFVRMLRTLAIFLMWIGVLGIVSFFLVKPITLILFGGPSLGMLGVIAYVGMAGILGNVGVLLFEVNRFVANRLCH
jgi:hypothetical protein